jgi:hypothetical protein
MLVGESSETTAIKEMANSQVNILKRKINQIEFLNDSLKTQLKQEKIKLAKSELKVKLLMGKLDN